jgi:hypothetical protein
VLAGAAACCYAVILAVKAGISTSCSGKARAQQRTATSSSCCYQRHQLLAASNPTGLSCSLHVVLQTVVVS